jgi:hypothetical protein
MNRLLAAALPLLIVTPAVAQDAGGNHHSWDSSQTKADAEQRASMIFDQLDANHDGFITQDEVDNFSKMMGDNPRMIARITKMFAESDTNHDGKVSADEAKANADRAFDAADTNHDGTLTPEERQAARQRAADQASPQQ